MRAPKTIRLDARTKGSAAVNDSRMATARCFQKDRPDGIL